jgi:SAM-dependent methyltransferase
MIVKKILSLLPRYIIKREFERQSFTKFNERPVELAFLFRKLCEVYPMKILDVGTGTTALPHMMRNCGALVSASDNIKDYWPSGIFNRHYHIINDDITRSAIKEKFDFITCISVLEHIENSDAAVSNMFNLLNPNGHLILTFPYNEERYVRNVYELPGSTYGIQNSYIAQAYSRSEINRWLSERNLIIRDQEYYQFWDGEYWTVGKQIIPPKKVEKTDCHQITCIHFQRLD